jgi:hypothetical protein
MNLPYINEEAGKAFLPGIQSGNASINYAGGSIG